jgi:O-antigen ligase
MTGLAALSLTPAFPPGTAAGARLEQSAFASHLVKPLGVVLSFEFVLAGLVCVGAYKQHPSFAWLFPADGTMLLMMLSVALGAVIVARSGITARATLPIALYLLFCAWMLLSVFWTRATSLAPLGEFFTRVVVVNGTIFALALAVVARNRGRTLRFLAAGVLLAAPLAADYVVNGGLGHKGLLEGRNYSLVGRIVSVGFGTLFGFMVYARVLTGRWLAFMLGAAALFYSSLITGSRQSFLAMVIQGAIVLAMAVHVTRGARSITIRAGVVPAVLAVAAAVAGVVVLAQSGDGWTVRRLASLVRYLDGEAGADQSAQVRVGYLTAAIAYWSDSWSSLLFGDGLFSFSQQFRGRYTAGTHPHNLIAAILCEFGLVGLTLFALLVASLLAIVDFRAVRSSPLGAVLAALAAGAAFRSLASGDLEGSFVLLVHLGLLASLRRPVLVVATSDGSCSDQPRAVAANVPAPLGTAGGPGAAGLPPPPAASPAVK